MDEQQAGGVRDAGALKADAKDVYKLGYDRVGPDAGKDWSGPGFACECKWSSRWHGDRCPEHGKIGTPIADPVDVLLAECQRLAAELAAVQQGQLSSAMFAAIDDSHTIQEQAERIGKLEAELAAVRAERDELLERTESLCEPNRSMVLKGYWVGEPTC